MRRADSLARGVVASSPSAEHDAAARRERPPRRVARRREAGAAGVGATIAPATATPSVGPTWREVVAIAAATPACARGIPDTAALVIGALTSPKPSPNTTYAASSRASGVVAVDAGQQQRTR